MVVNKLESSFPRSSMIFPNQYSPSGFRTKDAGDMTVMEVACVLLCIKHMGKQDFFSYFSVYSFIRTGINF